MKKVLCLIVALALIFTLTACGKNRLVGNWVCAEVHGGYPDQMTLLSDGTGTADGYSCNWSVQNNQLILNVGNAFIGQKTYSLEIAGDMLYLDEYEYYKTFE